jgi:hypothetical protein
MVSVQKLRYTIECTGCTIRYVYKCIQCTTLCNQEFQIPELHASQIFVPPVRSHHFISSSNSNSTPFLFHLDRWAELAHLSDLGSINIEQDRRRNHGNAEETKQGRSPVDAEVEIHGSSKQGETGASKGP